MNDSLLGAVFILGAGSAAMALTFSTLGWITALLLKAAGAPLRHNLLLVAILLTLASPALAALAYEQGWGGLIWKRPAPVTASQVPQTFGAYGGSVQSSSIISSVPSATPLPVPEVLQPVRSHPALEELGPWLIGAAFLGWAAGALFGLCKLGRDLMRIRRFKQALIDCADPALPIGAANEAALAATPSSRLSGNPQIVTTLLTAVPMVIGIRRPVIALPAQAWDQWTCKEKEAVLLHETAHIERNDALIAMLARLTRILFWWCAPLHGAVSSLNRLREQICDDHVLLCQGHGKNLAQAMVHLVEQVSLAANRLHPEVLEQGLGMWDGRSSDLEVRLRNLLNSRRIAMTRMSLKASWVLFGFALVALPAGVALQIGAQEPAPTHPDAVQAPKDLPGPTLPNPPASAATKSGKASAGENLTLTRVQKIGAACRAYAAAHQGEWPRTLADLKTTLANWNEVTTHPEHAASCAFHYIAPAKPSENPHLTAVLIETRKGQPDPDGFTAFVDGHVEFNTPQVEVVIRLMESEKPLNFNKDLSTESDQPKQGGQSKQAPASVHTVLSQEQLRQALTLAQQDRTTNVISTPRMTLLEKQTGVIQVGEFIPYEPKKTQTATEAHDPKETRAFVGFRVEVTPQLQDDQIQLTVHSELSTNQLQKDGTSKKIEQFDVKWFAKAKSGQTVYLQIEPEKGKSKYLFLTPTTQKLIPVQNK